MVEDGRVDIHFAIPLPDPPPDTWNPSVSTHSHLRSNGQQGGGVVDDPVDDRGAGRGRRHGRGGGVGDAAPLKMGRLPSRARLMWRCC